MIVDLTPDTYFDTVKIEGPLHVVMHYGETCGPCNLTKPYYQAVVDHFVDHKVTNVKFYRFHQWEQSYREFIDKNDLKLPGVPTLRFYFMGDFMNQYTRSYNDADELKKGIIDIIETIETTMGEFNLYES
jgi:thiol-disulfide isomerase/thioredoxin